MWSSPLYVKNEIIEDKNYNISYKRENIKKKENTWFESSVQQTVEPILCFFCQKDENQS